MLITHLSVSHENTILLLVVNILVQMVQIVITDIFHCWHCDVISEKASLITLMMDVLHLVIRGTVGHASMHNTTTLALAYLNGKWQQLLLCVNMCIVRNFYSNTLSEFDF